MLVQLIHNILVAIRCRHWRRRGTTLEIFGDYITLYQIISFNIMLVHITVTRFCHCAYLGIVVHHPVFDSSVCRVGWHCHICYHSNQHTCACSSCTDILGYVHFRANTDSIRFDSIRFDLIRFDSIRFDSQPLHSCHWQCCGASSHLISQQQISSVVTFGLPDA